MSVGFHLRTASSYVNFEPCLLRLYLYGGLGNQSYVEKNMKKKRVGFVFVFCICFVFIYIIQSI